MTISKINIMATVKGSTIIRDRENANARANANFNAGNFNAETQARIEGNAIGGVRGPNGGWVYPNSRPLGTGNIVATVNGSPNVGGATSGGGSGGSRSSNLSGKSYNDLVNTDIGALVEPDDVFSFDVDAAGNLVNAKLEREGVAGTGMNFPTALHLAKTTGFLVGRSSWQTADSGKWLYYYGVAWFLLLMDGSELVTSEGVTREVAPNFTYGDALSEDWILPPGAGAAGYLQFEPFESTINGKTQKYNPLSPPTRIGYGITL